MDAASDVGAAFILMKRGDLSLKNSSVQRLTHCALLSALICLLTMFPRIALPSGYVHLGDGLILISSMLLGLWSIPAAAMGSMLADLLAFPAYAPATFLIKGLTALTAAALMGKASARWRILLAFIAAEAVMVAGYFAFEWLFFPEYALADLPGNILQAVFGLVVGMLGRRAVPRLRGFLR